MSRKKKVSTWKMHIDSERWEGKVQPEPNQLDASPDVIYGNV